MGLGHGYIWGLLFNLLMFLLRTTHFENNTTYMLKPLKCVFHLSQQSFKGLHLKARFPRKQTLKAGSEVHAFCLDGDPLNHRELGSETGRGGSQ